MDLKLDKSGLVPAVVQDAATKEVLMVAWMNPEAFQKTQETGFAYFYSRTRKKLWKKGESSGNVMQVLEMRVDCDADTLLLLVTPSGPACHTGNRTCFYRKVEKQDTKVNRKQKEEKQDPEG